MEYTCKEVLKEKYIVSVVCVGNSLVQNVPKIWTWISKHIGFPNFKRENFHQNFIAYSVFQKKLHSNVNYFVHCVGNLIVPAWKNRATCPDAFSTFQCIVLYNQRVDCLCHSFNLTFLSSWILTFSTARDFVLCIENLIGWKVQEVIATRIWCFLARWW